MEQRTPGVRKDTSMSSDETQQQASTADAVTMIPENRGSKLVILSASSGSGHTRAGEALEAAAAHVPGISSVRHIDVLEYASALLAELYADLYKQMVSKTPSLWGWWYDKSDAPWKGEHFRVAMERSQMQPLMECLKAEAPDITICTHFLPSDIVSYMLQHEQISTRHAVVVTDLHVHALWLCHQFERYFVSTDESAYYLRQIGFPDDRITVTGIPIHPAFSQPMDREALRRKYEIAPSLPVVLLSAGTFGMESSLVAIRALLHMERPAQIVALCGKNKDLLTEVVHATEAAPAHLKFRALPYTPDMHEWMAISDLFIGKPGGLTLSEAMASALPMILLNPIPGQEEINAASILEEGVAVSPTDVVTLPYKVDLLLREPQRLARMRDRMKKLAQPRAAYTILETLLGAQPGIT
ncbi:MAG TPA: galactosyldiacylglycerol synthase [Verrucomicrobia bacterium]|nr:galactosyldiacylglycerol synthase [Verrucomicrobiota bacterium]